MRHEKLIAKAIYRFDAQLDTPISIGCSDSYFTDHDIIRSNSGEIIIPGSSIAGSIGSYVKSRNDQTLSFFKIEEKLASPFSISDGLLTSEVSSRTRDGVAILGYENEVFEKTAKNTAKFDYEIIPTDSTFFFIIEITLRENFASYIPSLKSFDYAKDALNFIEKQIQEVAGRFNNHEIRLGFKKNRGLGCIHIKSLKGRKFIKNDENDDLSEYLDYLNGKIELNSLDIPNNLQANSLCIEIPIQMLGGLSIKSYTENPEVSYDYTQLDHNGKAVIPGSAICGALRHQMEKIAKELNCNMDLEELFGTSSENDSNPHSSELVAEECYLADGHFLLSTRTAIDRFTGSALNQSLFTQKIYVNGSTTLRFYINKKEKLKSFIGLFLLAIKDLLNGYCSIGGSTSIGYGIVKGKEILVDDKPIDIENNEYITALAERISQNE
mgnify:CR=1 FL=1